MLALSPVCKTSLLAMTLTLLEGICYKFETSYSNCTHWEKVECAKPITLLCFIIYSPDFDVTVVSNTRLIPLSPFILSGALGNLGLHSKSLCTEMKKCKVVQR